MKTFDVVILGAGAAGLMCAIEAGKRGRQVAVLERAHRSGKKILISGGGRCNFTNIHCSSDNFVSNDPHFAKSTLARYTAEDFIALVEAHGIAYHEKTLGQLFCDDSAAQITEMLETECRAASVEILVDVKVGKVSHSGGTFVIETEGETFAAASLVVATGGMSIPKIGATGFGYELARQFGVNIVTPRPALVPFVFYGADRKTFEKLAGISAEVIASIERVKFREKMLFTHRGLSGPAILQISSYWRPGQEVHIDLAPGIEATLGIRNAKTRNENVARKALQAILPNRLADQWLELHLPETWTNPALHELENKLHDWAVKPSDTEGYEKAEVTAGGVDTRELSSKTMECREVPGLYFIGEVVDVTGQLGGFNFQWAWASGAAAGRAV
ncbi:MAG: NAD(P)/FAD-dependent oxidoreductase [Candidatus Acidiferrum sp.]